MKKLIFLIPIILFFACKNEPEQPEEPAADTTIIFDAQPRSMARAVTPGGQTYELLANGDSLFYKDTTVNIPYTYKTTEKHPKNPTPGVNTPPIARAGANQILTLPTNTTKLDASASTDAENNIKSFGWRKVSGPGATITDSNKMIATISNLVKGVYVYELRVADQLNAFTADQVRITVNDAVPQNQPPVARASANPSSITLPASTVSLTAAASTDADGTIASWLWDKRSGPPATIQNPTNATTNVSGLSAGNYEFRVIVKDNLGAEDQETVSVTVNPQVIPPDGNPVPFSLNSIPTSDPDLNNAGRGAEDWHNQNTVNIPSEGTNTQRVDAYFRSQLTWAMLEKGQGQYDMSPLINLLNSCISKRQKISFGIMTVYHDNEPVVISYDGGRSSYPQYLHNLMQSESCKDWKTSYGGWVPNYNSPHYLGRLKALHGVVNNTLETGSFQGIRYKDVVNSIDVRGYGNYGEWHNGGIVDNVSQIPSCARASSATLKAIIDAHTSVFQNFQLSIIMTAFDYFLQHTMTSPEVGYYALTTRNAYGPLGWRRDNWGAGDGTGDTYIDDLLIDNVGTWNGVQLKTLIMKVWEKAPVTGEPMNSTSNSFSELNDQVRKYHAASFGNGNITFSPNTATKNNFRAASKSCGYRLITTGGTYQLGASSITIKNNWQNIGIAPNYDNWNIVYEMVSSSGAVTAIGNSTFKLRLFLPGSTSHSDTFPLNLPSGTYTLRMVVKDPTGYRPPLQLAIQGRNSDGSYNLKTGIQR